MSKVIKAKPARPGYALVVDHEATKKYGRRMVKWVPTNSNKEELK